MQSVEAGKCGMGEDEFRKDRSADIAPPSATLQFLEARAGAEYAALPSRLAGTISAYSNRATPQLARITAGSGEGCIEVPVPGEGHEHDWSPGTGRWAAGGQRAWRVGQEGR